MGSGSAGRLFQILREDKGYTYGAYSFIPRRINQSYFGASSSVRSNVTKESVQVFNDIFKKYQTTFTETDLKKTQNALLKKNALEFETLSDKLGVLQSISTFSLPIDYVKQEEKVVTEMTLPRIKELIKKYINPNRMIYIVVGDAATQLEGLKNVGFGEPVLIDQNGDAVK